jgi:hypothetical protein
MPCEPGFLVLLVKKYEGLRRASAGARRMAGEIEPLLSQPNAAKALAHFARALSVARAQRAKSWEL